MSAHATMPLERATYQGIVPMGQLPLVDVCDVTRWDDELEGLGVVLVVAAWLVTVGVGMALRIAAQDRELKVAFTIVTLLFVGAGMLSWRAVVRWRRSRSHARTA
jgi:hypothetical protein